MCSHSSEPHGVFHPEGECPHAGREATPDELRALADQIESRECTGVVAVWCPVHGDCRGCTRREDGEWVEFHPACPLHSDRSAHAAGVLP